MMGKFIIVKYKCCGKLMFACAVELVDRETKRSIMEYALEGNSVETVDIEKVPELLVIGRCECKK
jgi:hypothetical protein